MNVCIYNRFQFMHIDDKYIDRCTFPLDFHTEMSNYNKEISSLPTYVTWYNLDWQS